ncbi:hypothetical protein V8F06_009421 [Rhypophila decipiens]
MHFTNLVNVLGLVLAATVTGVIATAIPSKDDDYVAPKAQGHGELQDCWCLDPRPVPSTLDGGDDGDIAGAPTHNCCREDIKPLGHRCPALGQPEQAEFKACCDRHALGAVCPLPTPE